MNILIIGNVFAIEDRDFSVDLVGPNFVRVIEGNTTKYIRKTENDDMVKIEILNEDGILENTLVLDKTTSIMTSSITDKSFKVEMTSEQETNYIVPYAYDGGTCPIGSRKSMEPISVSFATLSNAVGYAGEAASYIAYLSTLRTGIIGIDFEVMSNIHDL